MNAETDSFGDHVTKSPPPFLKAWFVFFLIATVGGAVGGGLLGGTLGAVLGANRVPLEQIRLAGMIAGFLVGLPISYFSFKWSVTKYLLD